MDLPITEKTLKKQQKSKKSTSTKLTKVGKIDYINSETGELETFNVIEERDQDFNFQKIWLAHLLESLDIIGNKKIKVLNYLLKNKDSENRIIATQRAIAKNAEVSLPVVNETIKALIAINAVKQIQQGVLMLNPEIVFQGQHQKRMNILLKYSKIETLEHKDQEQL